LLRTGLFSSSNQCLSTTDRKTTGGSIVLIKFRPILKERRCNLAIIMFLKATTGEYFKIPEVEEAFSESK